MPPFPPVPGSLTIPHLENQTCDSGAVCFTGVSVRNPAKRRFGDLLHLQVYKITYKITFYTILFTIYNQQYR